MHEDPSTGTEKAAARVGWLGSVTKSAAEMVRKTKLVEQHDGVLPVGAIKTANLRPSAQVLLPVGDGKYLMQLANSNPKLFRIPGGGVEKGETAEDALVREIKEELGVDVQREALRYRGHDPRPGYSENAIYEWLDHGLRAGERQASNDPNEKVRLAVRKLGAKGYLGPLLEELVQRQSAGQLKTATSGFGHTPSKTGQMSLNEWCRRIGNVASGPARIIPFNPVTRKLEDPLEKGAVLGYKALTGHTGPIKTIIKHLRAAGLGGMGGKVVDPVTGVARHTPISRVIPEAAAARLPNTGHLPVGSSSHSVSRNQIQVGKGRPRIGITEKDGILDYTPGIPGGTNPSPIASMLHEGGHYMHRTALMDAVKRSPDKFGGNIGGWRMREHGLHDVPGQPAAVGTALDELGANNAAMQALRQAGASSEALNFYQTVRYPSFRTYLPGLTDAATPLSAQIRQAGQYGYTPGFKGLEQFYSGAAKQASTLPGDLRRAINETHTHPTPGQIDAGNYRKGTLPWNGLTIKIENPEGTTRSGVSKSGKKWSVVMKSTYGYFRNTYGKDGDPVDVFIGPDLDSDKVAVIDQEIDGKFDEHKVVIGIKDEKEARETYLANYEKGWKCGPITMTDVEGFKTWLREGATKQPFSMSEQALIAQGSCCGHGCKNCPYTPKHTKGATALREKSAMVVTDGETAKVVQRQAPDGSGPMTQRRMSERLNAYAGSLGRTQPATVATPKPKAPSKPAAPRISEVKPQPGVYGDPAKGPVTVRPVKAPHETPAQANERHFNEWYKGYLKREGGVTVDSGGYTNKGVAETSGLTKQQIQAMSDNDIRNFYRDRYAKLEGIKDPVVRAATMEAGMNGGMALPARSLQRASGAPVDGRIGPGTLRAVNSAWPSAMVRGVMDGWRNRHNHLTANNPDKYGRYAKGWRNRRNHFAQSLPPGAIGR